MHNVICYYKFRGNLLPVLVVGFFGEEGSCGEEQGCSGFRKQVSVSIESGRCEKGMDFFAVECYPSCLPDMGQSVLFIAPWLTRSHAATCPRVPKHTETSVHRLVLFDP